jgi:hypothetical protein
MSAPRTDPAEPTTSRSRTDLAAGLAATVAVVALILIVPELRHSVGLALHGHFGALRTYIRSLGAGGLALLLGLMVAHAVVFYPSEIVTATAAFVYGFGPGLGLVICGWLRPRCCPTRWDAASAARCCVHCSASASRGSSAESPTAGSRCCWQGG